MFKKVLTICIGAGISLAAASLALASEAGKTTPKKRAEKPVEIRVVPVGLPQDDIEKIKDAVERSAAVQKELSGTSHRLLAFEYLETNDKSTVGEFAPKQFRATFYDYTNERTLLAVGDLARPEAVRVIESAEVPLPNDEEFEIAVRILTGNSAFSAAVKNNTLRAFRPMPPTTVSDSGERLINVGLTSFSDSTRNEVVSVSLKAERVVRYPDNAPPTSKAVPEACGVPDAGQATTSRGTAGQYQTTIMQNGSPLWEFLVLRPSASSGTRASGIELRDVRYKGKMVLKRGNAPVLNVLYTPLPGQITCGPYRDWQYQEDSFSAPDAGAQDPAPGVRILAAGQIATTALDTGNDTGNFRGVAMYRQNNETVMVTELQAGWYRYIMEWRLADDGTIRPRFGFGATDNSCVCSVHVHHVYWRLDFDIVNTNNKLFVAERGRKFLQPLLTESILTRKYQTNRSVVVQNGSGDEAYMVVPSTTDGIADNYGRSDLWMLRYKNVAGGSNLQNELDDGYNSTGGTCTATGGSCININPFANGESLDNQDAVVWYGAHYIHSDGANLLDPDRSGLILSGSHVVGPDIRPIRW